MNGELERQLADALGSVPPDFAAARCLLELGADINACDGECDGTILVSAIEEYSEDSCDGRYLPEIVGFFIENGFDLGAQNGKVGAAALYSLVFSSYDKYIIDAAKLMLDAGADPRVAPYKDGDDEEDDLLGVIGFKLAGCSYMNDHDCECLMKLYYDIAEAAVNGKPYADMFTADAVIGKTVRRIYSLACCPEEAVFDFETDTRSFTDCFVEPIVLEFENLPLVIDNYCCASVNPYRVSECRNRTELPQIEHLIGKTATEIEFCAIPCRDGDRIRAYSLMRMTFTDGSCFYIRDNAECENEKYCAFFGYSEDKSEDFLTLKWDPNAHDEDFDVD